MKKLMNKLALAVCMVSAMPMMSFAGIAACNALENCVSDWCIILSIANCVGGWIVW
jgi:hypothetical protein